jgi:hypothetical protein
MRSKMGVLRGEAHGPRGCELTNQGQHRVYYDIDRVLDLLQQYCPDAFQDFPSVDSLQTFRGVDAGATNPTPIALLEVGRPWGATSPESGDMPKLCVWDKGGYHSDAPDLVPYTYGGQPGEAHSERALIEANGFDAIGIFAEFCECSTVHRKPKLDDAYVVALFQFIMMLRSNRRYYYYGERHQDPPEEHLRDLVGAMKIVTYKSRMARLLEVPLSIPGAALPSQQPPPAQVTAQPYQNPFGPTHRQAYQQPSYLASHPFDPAWSQPPHQTPSFLPQGGIQSQMLHPAFRSLRPGRPESGTSEKQSSLLPPSLEPGLLAPAMDTNRDVAHVARESETYSERMKRLGAERQARTQAGESVQQAADAGEQPTDLRSREDSVLRGNVDEQSRKFDLVVCEAGNGLMGNKNTTEKFSPLEAETPSPPLDDRTQ